MARHEQDREDLLREAVALVERAELKMEGFKEPIFFGFRRDDCCSLYFGPQLVLHFNTSGELRRAFDQGRLLKAERGQLIAMSRERTDAETALISQPLSPDEQARFLQTCESHLQQLQAALALGGFQVLGQVPENGKVVERFMTWLSNILSRPMAIAQRPHAK